MASGKLKVQSRSPEYVSWNSMKDRCLNKNSSSWEYYGGKGITVCERWKTFSLFLEDMGERKQGTSLDRIDGSKGYEPGNVRWATKSVQMKNRNMDWFVDKQRQSHRGKMGMAKRWEGHIAESTTKPWEAIGISRRTYYNRKKAGSLKA